MVVDTKVLKMRVYKCLDDRKFPYSFTIKNNKIIKKLKATEIVKISFQEQCNCLCTYQVKLSEVKRLHCFTINESRLKRIELHQQIQWSWFSCSMKWISCSR